MLKGAASALLVLILVGMAMGVLLMNQLPDAPTNQEMSQEPVVQTPDADPSPIPLLPEAGGGGEQSTLADEWAAVDAERQRLREWEESLQQQQDDLDAKLAALDAWEAELQDKEARLEEDLAVLAAERADLERWRGELEETQNLLNRQRAELLVGWTDIDQAWTRLAQEEQRMQTLVSWGHITLIASATTAIVHLAIIVQHLHQCVQQRPVATPEVNGLRRAYLRPISKTRERPSPRLQ